MKTMSLHAAAALTVAAMTIVGLAPPATAASTAIDLTGATATGTVVEVTGTLVLGDDALGEVEVATDGTGDVYVPQAGLDVGNATVRTDVAQKQLVFKLRVNDGNMATDGIAPAFGYGWELVVDGDSTPNYWLAAGHAGSNSPPRTGKWWTLCTTPDGWICSSDIPGTMSRTETTWTLPFDMAKVQFGSVIEPGNGYAGAPGSFPWPSRYVFYGLAPSDLTTIPLAYKVPGEVLIGIAPQGVPESQVKFTTKGAFDPATGTFSGAVAVPASPGAHTVWVKSCHGLAQSPTCVSDSEDVTI